jgi:WhiB family redox-sensing transcriptional regulator
MTCLTVETLTPIPDSSEGRPVMLALHTIHDIELDEVLEAPVPDWSTARCRDGNGTLTHLFFSDDLLTIARAKAICAKCHLRAECISDALDRQEPWGVWGGELLANGKILAQKRNRGRPPKVRPPELLSPVIPVREVLAARQSA